MKTRTFTINAVIVIIIAIFNSCQSNTADEKGKQLSAVKQTNSGKQNLNISILIDLSDRIDPGKNANPSMEYYKRDLGYIESVSEGFEKHLLSKQTRQIDDQIQVFFEPEPLNSGINTLAKKLKLSFTKGTTTKDAILQVSPQYISSTNEIYKLAIKDKTYVGSDIWGFFKNKINDYCIKPNHRNILFILTDGYIFHKDSKFMEGNRSSYLNPELIRALKLNTSDYKNKIQKAGYGFVKANDDLSELEVFVLGINPNKRNPFESDVIKEYWNKWLTEMKVKSSAIKLAPADLPSNLDPIIKKYINQ